MNKMYKKEQDSLDHQRCRVNSICIHNSFWIEKRESFFSFLIGKNLVIYGFESSLLVEAMFTASSRTRMYFCKVPSLFFQNTFVESFAAELSFVRY